MSNISQQELKRVIGNYQIIIRISNAILAKATLNNSNIDQRNDIRRIKMRCNQLIYKYKEYIKH